MKKFENPIMNVTLFDTENVVTTASSETPVQETAVDQATTAAVKLAGEAKTFTIIF